MNSIPFDKTHLEGDDRLGDGIGGRLLAEPPPDQDAEIVREGDLLVVGREYLPVGIEEMNLDVPLALAHRKNHVLVIKKILASAKR